MSTSTVCIIVKNEERSILEWLSYQRVLGFDQINVYDNDSNDRTADIVARAMSNDAAISYTRWPNEPGRRPQMSAYADALVRCTTDWIAFFDTDEFLLPKRCDTVNAYLATIRPQVSAIMLNWLIFGSSGHEAADDSFLVIERFTKCAVERHGKNFFTKTIVRPQDVERMQVHSAVLKAGEYANSSGHPVKLAGEAKTSSVDHDGAQLNHYLLKTRQDYRSKVAKGHASRALEDKAKLHITDPEAFWRDHDLNDREELTIIDRYRAAVVVRMAQLSS